MAVDFKELARLILQGWCDHSNALSQCKPGDPPIRVEDAYAKLVDNPADAETLSLFSHWSNDLTSIFGTAAHIRLTLEVVNDRWEVKDVPDPVIAAGASLEDYYWSCGTYEWSSDLKAMVWRTGRWEYFPVSSKGEFAVG